MGYAAAAWERAMTVQEVVLKALSGEIHWFRAAGILGMSAPDVVAGDLSPEVAAEAALAPDVDVVETLTP